MNANVVLCKCLKSKKLYGMRIEERDNDWFRTWAFKITENKAKHEGYEKMKIIGSLQPTLEYPGCPYCGTSNIVHCGTCGKMSCRSSESDIFICPWCGQKGEIQLVDTIEFKGGGL